MHSPICSKLDMCNEGPPLNVPAHVLLHSKRPLLDEPSTRHNSFMHSPIYSKLHMCNEGPPLNAPAHVWLWSKCPLLAEPSTSHNSFMHCPICSKFQICHEDPPLNALSPSGFVRSASWWTNKTLLFFPFCQVFSPFSLRATASALLRPPRWHGAARARLTLLAVF